MQVLAVKRFGRLGCPHAKATLDTQNRQHRQRAMNIAAAQGSESRSIILHLLLRHKDAGLTLDELSGELGISRNAIRQHVDVLERGGLVRVAGRRTATGGRPSRSYGLTEAGLETFPRQYDMLAEGMLATVREELGEEALEALLARMAHDVAVGQRDVLATLPEAARREAVVALMNRLGYEAHVEEDGTIVAVNCVFHKLAAKTRAVCRYDERLLSNLLGYGVRLGGCMQDGANGCAFVAASQVGAGAAVFDQHRDRSAKD